MAVEAHFEAIHRQRSPHVFVHGLHFRSRGQAIADIRLIGHHDQQKSCAFELLETRAASG